MPIVGADGGAPGLQPKAEAQGQIGLCAGRILTDKKERIRFGSAHFWCAEVKETRCQARMGRVWEGIGYSLPRN